MSSEERDAYLAANKDSGNKRFVSFALMLGRYVRALMLTGLQT